MGDPFRGVTGGGFVQVGDHQVRQRDVSQAVDQELNRIREESQGKEILSPRDAAQRGLTQQILSQLIYRASMLAYADKIGVKASSTAGNNLLTQAPRFKDALGRVNMDEVRRYAAEQNMTVPQFEEDIRKSMTTSYLEAAAFTGVVTPEILSAPLLDYFGETRTVSIARITNTTIPEPKAPTDQELQAWYDQHAAEFRQPERRRISVFSYSFADFMDKVDIKDTDIKAQYDRRIREFSTPETRMVAQFTGERAALQGFVDLVKQGVALDQALARSTSVTRADLTLKPGDVTAQNPNDENQKKYDDFLFAIPANTIQGPVQVGDKWFAVQVTSIAEGVATPFEQVREQIRDDIAKTEARRLFDGTYESFYDMAGGISLEEISVQIGAPVIQLAPVDASGRTEGGLRSSLIDQHAEAVRGLFTLGAGQTTDVVEGDGERAILRVDEIIAPHTLPFEQVKDKVRIGFLREKIEQEANRVANEVVAAVKAGKTFDEAARASRMNAIGGIQVMRGGQGQIDPQVQAGLFNVAIGDTAVVRGQGNEPWVVHVEKSTPVSPETAAAIKTQIDNQMQQSLGNDLRETFFRGLQKEVKINTNDAAITAYLQNLTKDEAQ
ncbi:MAG TPA: peptidyl-prolyl cis-trans isomerase, partial [Hyphomonadaceae bacterium]|nr:peptidyl-prolyl cis-trans isomerase [Hyphomonadaceae bacterium]